jgi:hypothetical protein
METRKMLIEQGPMHSALAASGRSPGILAFLMVLVAQYVGCKILLVLRLRPVPHNEGRAKTGWPCTAIKSRSTGCPHTHRPLNLIERLWGHIKRTVLANVLFLTLDDLVIAWAKPACARPLDGRVRRPNARARIPAALLQPVLPAGFQKVRHYRFLGPRSTTSIEAVRWLISLHNAAVFTFRPSRPMIGPGGPGSVARPAEV